MLYSVVANNDIKKLMINIFTPSADDDDDVQ